jgi:HlyD family secretion protein
MNKKLLIGQFLTGLALTMLVVGCKPPHSHLLQGYVEGEFVYVSSPLSGRVVALAVRQGDPVKAGDALFTLDDMPEKALRDQAAQQVQQTRATLEDARKGKRPSEIEALQEQLKQTLEAAALSEKQLARKESLVKSKAVAVEDLDQARSTHLQNQSRVAQLEAELRTAQLGSRSDFIAASEAALRAAEAALAKLEWDVQQKTVKAPQTGLVNDLLYRAGEWVAAGKPILTLLPPENVKVRTFISETRIAAVHLGDVMQVSVDGIAAPIAGRVSFISPQAEYTPPVIYNRENRSKLVFMVELRFDDGIAAKLHPGQPVDVKPTAAP